MINKSWKRSVKVITCLFLCIQLIAAFNFTQSSKTVSATTLNQPSFKILEIVAVKGKSRFPSEVESVKLDVTTITMKQFVAQRDELDGKYDAIAIMDGVYTSEPAQRGETVNDRADAHNTVNKMNDITNLRAQQIKDEFINKNQLVILHEPSITNTKATKLKANFGTYLNGRANVIKYNQDLLTPLKQYLKNKTKQRPRISVNNPPTLENQYKPGDTVRFNYEVLNYDALTSGNVSVRLYIDSDFNDHYESPEIVLEQPVNNEKDEITYRLPKGYSGIRNWKLEVVDNGNNGWKDYLTGRFKFKHTEVQVNVLRVMPNTSKNSALVKSNGDSNTLNKDLLKRDGEYKINIDVIQMKDFNSSYYKTLNQKYGMVIFGFGDMYSDNAPLTTDSIKSINQFIDSKQSLMFTHDTIISYNSNNTKQWLSNFKLDTGQIDPWSNLGFEGPNKSKTTSRVNEGLITTYPFQLDSNVDIATTHNQYYTLNLEDKEIIPWYNITGSNRDNNDSWNHYYTYSKGSITYSGSGHTDQNFEAEEQQLFVNTMYRAFLGSNHKPYITVMTPELNTAKDAAINPVPINQDISLSYLLEDYDLVDKKLNTKVFMKNAAEDDTKYKEVYSKNDVTNGGTVDTKIKHGLTNDGEVIIKIVAEDEQGAEVVQIFKMKIVKIKSSLEVSRTTDAMNPTPIKQPVNINYTITPKPIMGSDAQLLINSNQDKVYLTNVVFKEVFPKNIAVNLAENQAVKVVKNVDNGTTEVIWKLDNILYERNGNNNEYIASPLALKIPVIPEKKDTYILTSSYITYNDFNSKLQRSDFNPVTIVAKVPLESVVIKEKYEFNYQQEYNFTNDLQINPIDADIHEIFWESSNPNVLQIDRKLGTAKAIGEGDCIVTVTVIDEFGNRKTTTTKVTVMIPLIDFGIDDMEIEVGKTQKLNLWLNPTTAKNKVTYELVEQKYVSFDPTNLNVTGLVQGETTITAWADGKKEPRKARIKVIGPFVESISVEPKEVTLQVNEIFEDFKVTIKPANAVDKNLKWETADTSIIKVEKIDDPNGTRARITGLEPGVATVNVTTPDGKFTETIRVTVTASIQSVTAENLVVVKGRSKESSYQILPIGTTNVKSIEFMSLDPYYVDVNRVTGVVTGKRLGRATVNLRVINNQDKEFSTTFQVDVVDKEMSSGEDKY